jgi:ATP-dependent DNA ligase
MLRMRTIPAGFIAPCLPTKTDKLPSGSRRLHEIKHDGFRIIARKNGKSKNPAAPAMKRETEEDWGRPKWR